MGIADSDRMEQENLRLKAAVRELALINEIASVINSTMTIEEISSRVIKKAVVALNAKEAVIHLFSDSEKEIKPITFVRGKFDSSESLKTGLDVRIGGWIASNKKPLMINDLARDEKFANMAAEHKDITSLLAVPLIFKGRLLGTLTAFNSLGEAGFSGDDLRLLSIIGVQAAQLIENARHYQEELRLKQLQGELEAGRKIQKGFLPRDIPHIPGYDIFGGSETAQDVGGDFFDFIPLNSHRVLFTIGDVSGKGLPAALLMSTIQAQVRLLIKRDVNMQPREMLSELNFITCNMSDAAQFATMVIGLIDLEANEIKLANAGHSFPVVVRSDGTIEEICEGSIMIGMIEDTTYPQVSCRLDNGELLAISSDGVDEAWDESETQFGLDRFYELLKRQAGATSEQIYRRVIDEVRTYRGGAQQSDDITLVIIKRIGR